MTVIRRNSRIGSRPGRRSGFTIAEILITLAVISIGFLGTMAALAFGMTASRDTAQHTVALNYNRRMLEMLNSKIFPYTLIANADPADPAINYTTESSEAAAGWYRLFYRPVYTLPAALTDWFSFDQWYPGANSPEGQRFAIESERYRVNISYRRDSIGGAEITDNTDPKFNMLHLVIQTRWRERVGKTTDGASKFRFVRTEAMLAQQ